jgi:uncharacterized protein
VHSAEHRFSSSVSVNYRRFGGIVFAILLGFSSGSHAQHTQAREAFTVRQTDLVTCGPAALATVLVHFAGIQTDLKAVIAQAEPLATKRGLPGGEQQGFNLLSLKGASLQLGLSARGFKTDVATLKTYFQEGGLPIIAHLNKPRPHFVVLIGQVGEHLILSDPAWGRKLERRDAYSISLNSE